ncbi:hypothetical protein [Pedobacter punctiformis]|uniref:Uncharacterized protein n=1 Tax=Pedobacter punctiformis TaxID=3004097 RepID=A0ABT4L7L0_9SPHI|nr:hypothetical protein [Pedobacter sp. HCMS5-2]MCZ4243912.1 hypothetical protein [Pedobacter sp. HCMS5-2]
MDKIRLLENNQIKIDFKPALVRIYSNEALWKFLEGYKFSGLEMLAEMIKTDYEKQFNKPLNITHDSLITEILVHIYCDYLGLRIHQAVRIKWIQHLLMKLIERAEIVDCGEKQVDSNRWLWNFLARYKNSLIKILPDNLNARKLKAY